MWYNSGMSLNRPRPAPKPRRTTRRKKKNARPRFARTWSDERGTSNGIFGPKVLALLAAVSLILVFGGIRACWNDQRKTEAAQRQSEVRDDGMPPPDRLPRQLQRKYVRRLKPSHPSATDLPAEPEVPNDPAPVEGASLPADDEMPVAVKQAPKRKVVFTDGPCIRTRPDGTVEVPRTFSYSGAGLKRPFWIYDRQLEKSGRIEHEARAEKAARDKWKALYDEAARQCAED